MPSSQLVNRLPSGREVVLNVTREMIYVETLLPQRERDPDWRYVDSHGHKHRWRTGHKKATWRRVEVGRYWCEDCRDEHIEYENRCRKCGNLVEPGMRDVANPVREIPGLFDVRLTVTEDNGDGWRIKSTYLVRGEEYKALTWPPGLTDEWVDAVAKGEPIIVEPTWSM